MSEQLVPKEELTSVLVTFGEEARGDVDDVVALIYDDLRAMARRQLGREYRQRTLATNDLVHEAYLKLVDYSKVTDRGRSYFYAAAARAMRQILVDQARRRRRLKRGGDAERVTLASEHGGDERFSVELLDLDRALASLAELDERQARVVECRYFGGLTVEETAAALDVSARTVKRDWNLARAWLFRKLRTTRTDAAG